MLNMRIEKRREKQGPGEMRTWLNIYTIIVKENF